MKNEDLNEDLPLPTFGLSTPNGIVYISTPRGTKTLDEYGTFKHFQDKLETGQSGEHFKFSEIKTNLKRSIIEVSPMQAIKKHVEEMTKDFSRKNPPHSPSQELPLPSLESINENLKEAGIEWQRREQIRQREKKKLIADLKRMTDHELRVYLNLMRHRANSTLGGSVVPTSQDMTKYMAALEEMERRRDAASKL